MCVLLSGSVRVDGGVCVLCLLVHVHVCGGAGEGREERERRRMLVCGVCMLVGVCGVRGVCCGVCCEMRVH